MTRIALTGLTRDIKRFVKFKHALGHPYQRAECTLRCFEHFAQEQARVHRRSTILLEPTLKAWLCRSGCRSAFTVAVDLGALRQLCLYRRRRDPTGFVPGIDWAPQTESIHVPYIFSREEVHRLLKAASRPRCHNVTSEALRTLMLILYCTGLRFGEAVRLRTTDIDLKQRKFVIHESKGRTRFVTFGDDLAREIKRYLVARQPLVRAADHGDALFLGRNCRPLTHNGLAEVVRRILRQEGLKPARGRVGPRPFDFRHAFAVHRLTDWYHKGKDVHALLPWLSAYMGHASILGTEVYLHATPELLSLASRRLQRRLNAPRR